MPHRIFLVEDHPVMRGAYARLIEREPDLALCGVAESAEACLDNLDPSACDLVVTDLALPGMDGLALTERLRDRHPALPTLVVSAYGKGHYAERALQAGARAYLTKDDLVRQLAPTIRRVLNGDDGAST